ncbi:Crp/Fnr family transcriptional regulator [Puia dinghuensis]|nr:cyclic nucleotide-binding domain-containing protein [Puia dinghuensis]
MEYPLSQLRKYHKLSDEFISDLKTRIRNIEAPKNSTLLLKGDICRDMYLIEKGMLICYDFKPETGEKYCAWLLSEGDFVTSVDSFNNQIPSTQTIITHTKSLLWAITKQDQDELTENHREFAAIRLKLNEIYNGRGREMDTKGKWPKEQFYEWLIYKYPYIAKATKVAQAHLLGISRDKLYEILKNRSEKK